MNGWHENPMVIKSGEDSAPVGEPVSGTLQILRSPARFIIALAASALLMYTIATASVGAEQSERGADRVAGLRFNDPKQTEFLKAVLKSMNLHYAVTATPEGEMVEWASLSTAQELEIQNRVSQYWFISTQCGGMQPPLPTQPALPSLSCSK
jgi:hypothetical protein